MLAFGLLDNGNVVLPLPADELLPTGQFRTQAEFDTWTVGGVDQVYVWTSATQSADRIVSGSATDELFTYPVELEVGATYSFTSTLTTYTANPRYYFNGGPDASVLLGQPLEIVANSASQIVGAAYGGSLFEMEDISLKFVRSANLFVNPTFATDINGWNNVGAWAWQSSTADVINSQLGPTDTFTQTFTLIAGATYEIQFDRIQAGLGGNAVYMIEGVDTNAAINQVYTFVANGTVDAETGVVGRGDDSSSVVVVDNARLQRVPAVEVVTFDGDLVTFDGEQVVW